MQAAARAAFPKGAALSCERASIRDAACVCSERSTAVGDARLPRRTGEEVARAVPAYLDSV
jgi:hypothetical protein